MAENDLRNRKVAAMTSYSPQPEPANNDVDGITRPVMSKSASAKLAAEDVKTTWWLDALRVLTFLFFVSCGLSYFISAGESWFWNMKNPPNYLRTDWWKIQFRSSIELTPTQLAAYDGTDPNKPIYLAINNTIFDVSANRRTYGPGGSYHVFAGVDASRGFVTGCFLEDRTGDMRGVEDMYLPIDDPEADAALGLGAEEMMLLKEEERKAAEKKVYDALKHWVDFFGKSKKYFKVGYVKRPKGWPSNEPMPKLCEQAELQREKRTTEPQA